jgi:hypothetical protein
MERYKNLGGDSNVISYELGNGSILVQFGDGFLYEYTNASAGASAIGGEDTKRNLKHDWIDRVCVWVICLR